ncbi:SGNH/GDSL hydrolase family protein [Zunongwangia sp. HRR-M8]|uniref:SGNH/GDSL hydrolase family protein n=1 Tax=Zunongwangia sp. HRR-M8 TaxID=3015170 RepID=UPI0022DD4C50|nr:SGNH/GDSL hydrolase family protein [Zunongwangia sp. HRR-M8]WBL23107.1 SGNH/GDSL hydrolase family protein [Zunongwangia sp. HRR-M8]
MKLKHLIYLGVLTISAGAFAQQQQYKKLMSQDWANLKWYREANNKVKMEGKPVTAAFMGNSITHGWYDKHPEFFKENNYIGRGIGGQTTPQMLIRFTQDVIDLQPKVVVILAGTNDVAGNTGYSSVKMITDNIKAMAQLAKANNIKVVLSSILPVEDYPWRPGLEPVAKIAEVNNWLKNYAEQNNHVYLDYFPALANDQQGMKKEYATDGVHPTSAGYDVMEPMVKNAIEKALKE